MPTRNQVHVDQMLTNISVAYMQDAAGFIADKVFPIIPVQRQSDRYFVYNKGDMLRDEAQERAPKTESAGSDYNVDNTPTYFCKQYAFHSDVDDVDRTNSNNPLQPDQDATEYVSQKLMLKKENVFVNSFLKTGVWEHDVEGVASGSTNGKSILKWSDYSASTPSNDVQNLAQIIKGSTGYRPNTLVLSSDVRAVLLNHPDIKDRVKYVGRAMPGQVNSILSEYFDVANVVVADSVVNKAGQGAKDDIDFIAKNSVLLCYSEPNPGLRKPSAGYIFAWTGLLGAGAFGNTITRFPMEWLGNNCERIEGTMAFDMKVVCKDLGVYCHDVI